MSLLSLIFGLKKCNHERMPLNVQCGYCPDCGEYVENRWYLVRCSCCGVKRVAITRRDEVFPKSRFCTNCGEEEYYIEELNSLSFVDINYATAKKICIETHRKSFTQSWIQEELCPVKLIPQSC